MDAEVESYYIQRLFSTIQQSVKIKKQIEFLNWLQHSVVEFIPLDMLMVVRGNFSDGAEKAELHYQVCSHVNGLSAHALTGTSREVNQCMVYLYERWLHQHRHFYVINNFAASEFDCKFRLIFPDFPQIINSLLVYGVSDAHDGNDTLYVFFSKHNKFQIKDSTIDLLMPHIDHALRKIEYSEPTKTLSRTVAPIDLPPIAGPISG